MLKVFAALIIILLTGNAFSTTAVETKLSEKVQRLNDLAMELSGEHNFSIDQGEKEITYTQKIALNNCLLKLETFKESAIVQRDNFDLSKRRVNRKHFPFKGASVIDFGLNTILS